MGRQKGVPQKRKFGNDSNELSSEPYNCYNYRPVVKKRKSNRSGTRFFTINLASASNKDYFIGTLSIGTTNNVMPDKYLLCKVSFRHSDEDDSELLVLDCDDTYVLINCIIPNAVLKEVVSNKIFSLYFWNNGDDVFIDIYFVTLPLTKFNNRIGNSIKTIFKLLLSIEDDSNSGHNVHLNSKMDIMNLYNHLLELREDIPLPKISENIQHDCLKPKLRPYQIKAVQWMLYREKSGVTEENVLHPLYTPVGLNSGKTVYFDKYTGHVNPEKPLVNISHKGGILADEMGLGKTVEVLACILLNPKDGCLKKYNVNVKPIIHKQKEKAEVKDNIDEKERNLKDEVYVQPSNAKKSITREALGIWYNNLLSQVSTSRKTVVNIKNESVVQCICGNTSESGTIQCDKCEKYQHFQCLGYKKKLGRYLCPQCWMDEPLIESGATLIVTPISLRTQWCKEISKHLKCDLNVLIYEGFSGCPIYPTQFKKYDVVITTYSVLQNELKLTEKLQVMGFRKKRKYSPPGSPLIRIKWWRLCLDEAQIVDTPGKMVSEMASKLHANFRWAVTGTPISKNISDLYGLIDYLQISPYKDHNCWKHILYNPYIKDNNKPLLELLSQILWRTAKKNILDQINIPNQTFQEHMLEFSAVEKFFYKREHELICNDFLSQVTKYDRSVLLQGLDKTTLKKLLTPLLTLRIACTYPNTVRGRYLATKKQVSTLKDLLDALISKSIVDCEDCLRLIISALNGLAGVHLLLQDPQQAINHYRNVLHLAAKFSGNQGDTKLTIDKLQLIHTMHNLSEVMLEYPPDQPTLHDSTLQKDCSDLEKKYLNRFINNATSAYESFSILLKNVNDLKNSFVLKEGQWYSDGLDWIYIRETYEEFLQKVQSACETANVECVPMPISERKILKLMFTWMDDVTYRRMELFETIDKLYDIQPITQKVLVKQELVDSVMRCHLRPETNSQKKFKCLFCISNDKLKQYEGNLFNMRQRKTTFEDMSLVGSWKPTKEEIIFKTLLTLLKAKSGNSDYIKDGETHIKCIETLKKEFKEVRRFWTMLDQQVCAQDELDICKVRLQLKETNNENGISKTPREMKNLKYNLENKFDFQNFINFHELNYQESSLSSEVRVNQTKLEKLLGTHSYLETLRKQQYEGQNPDPCPICKNPLEQQWCILLCGHSYCLECLQVLLEQTMKNNIQCCICRNVQKYQEISYIKSGKTTTEEDCVDIKGSYSTKIEAVIKLVLKLKFNDPEVKVLVFSSWVTVLKSLREALIDNSIHCELAENTHLEVKIENFKDMSKNVTVLLLPIHLGSKGLNLVEATHVILVEPLLNPADELQAIGRVHRIGQTKPTVVHKFLVKNTIEESIYQATNTDADSWDKSKVTVQHLVNLFQHDIVHDDADMNHGNGGIIQDNADIQDNTDMTYDNSDMENNCNTNIIQVNADMIQNNTHIIQDNTDINQDTTDFI